MRLAVIAISAVLTVVPGWGQRYARRPAASGPNGPALTLKIKSLKSHPRAITSRAASAPAPVVVQVFVDPSSGTLSAFGVFTAAIPAGTQIGGSMTLLDDNSSINFQQVPLQQDLAVGDFIALPSISNFGDVWGPSVGASFSYTVQIIPARGAATAAEGTFLVGETLANADLVNFEPIIASVSQSIAANKDVILKLPGLYSGSPVQVVLADLFLAYVPPANAITITPTEVDVDLSLIPAAQGFDLTSLDSLLVSVNEDNHCDTVAFRYLPPAPGTFTHQQ